jgi:DNA helicase II / ATP-dependent DNA helicase PcrA
VNRFVSPDEWVPKDVLGLESSALKVVRSTENGLIVAGPGAGKTETLAQRASFLLETRTCAHPYQILAISFKRDAASNLKDRVSRRCGTDLGSRFESYTFDAWAKSLLDRFRPALPDVYRPTADYILDWKVNNDAPLQSRLLAIGPRIGFSADRIHQMGISEFYRHHIRETPLSLQPPSSPGTESSLAHAVWQSLLFSGKRSVLDFSMIGALAELILRTNPRLVELVRATYQYLFLDEFQDTTGNQFNLLTTAFLNSGTVISAVGDNKQRIMLWAGAKRDVFKEFERVFGARPYTLRTNYRSAPRLIAIQNHLIEQMSPEQDVTMIPPPGRADGGECRILVFSNDNDESQTLVESIVSWVKVDGVPANEICLLVRQRPDMYMALLKDSLSKQGISLRAQDALQDLLAEPLTRMIVNCVSVSCKETAPEEWIALRDEVVELKGFDMESPKSYKAVNELSTFIEASRNRLLLCASKEAFRSVILELITFVGESSFRQRHERYLQEDFFSKIFDDCLSALLDARGRRNSWSEAIDDFVGIGSVPIMSIHKSKGLEFHTVVFMGLEDFPFSRGLKEKNGEEDCNIFVAFSRAKERVIITTVDERFGYSQSRSEVLKFFKVFAKAGVKAERISKA